MRGAPVRDVLRSCFASFFSLVGPTGEGRALSVVTTTTRP